MFLDRKVWADSADLYHTAPGSILTFHHREETVDSYCYTKVWRVKPVYQQITLSPWLGAAGIIILWHFRAPLLIFISVAFSPRPLKIGMLFQTLLSPLLKVQSIVLIGRDCWKVGTSLPGPGPGEWLSFRLVTRNSSDSESSASFGCITLYEPHHEKTCLRGFRLGLKPACSAAETS